MITPFRHLEINGGRVEQQQTIRLTLPSDVEGYSDAQIDDYGGHRRKEYLWQAGTQLDLRARFSHKSGDLLGTSGFGFWNTPFGDPSVRWPALPKAVWFFYASGRSNLPLAPLGPGRGWFASTIDATGAGALMMVPIAPLLVLLNNNKKLRQILWPRIRHGLNVSYQTIETRMDEWHLYRLCWLKDGCEFWVDGESVLKSSFSPRGPLGFVCWIDNQYLVVTPSGRLQWGTQTVQNKQWMELSDLSVAAVENCGQDVAI